MIHHNQLGFIPGIQDRFNIQKPINVIHHINRLKKKKKSHDHIIRCRKAFDKIQHPLIIKTPSKLGIDGNLLNLIKNTEKKKKKEQQYRVLEMLTLFLLTCVFHFFYRVNNNHTEEQMRW